MERNSRKVRRGVVVSNKMDKTVVVKVETLILHKKYHKFIKRSKKFMAHDESNELLPGDIVEIMETRPLSKCKHFIVVKLIERPIGASEN